MTRFPPQTIRSRVSRPSSTLSLSYLSPIILAPLMLRENALCNFISGGCVTLNLCLGVYPVERAMAQAKNLRTSMLISPNRPGQSQVYSDHSMFYDYHKRSSSGLCVRDTDRFSYTSRCGYSQVCFLVHAERPETQPQANNP